MRLGPGVVTALASLLAAVVGYYAAAAVFSSSAVASASVVATREAALPTARFYANRAAVASAEPKHVLLGVMSNPGNNVLRTGIREWSARFASHRKAVDVRFVYGTSFYNASTAPAAALASLERERAEHDDFFFVDGRERLPHVGVVTEKSAAWWRTVAERMPGYRYYCKSDDDTLVHLDHLTALIDELQRALPADKPVYMGHTKWRAWNACGGGWGAAKKTTNDLRQSSDCPHAAGPYPYMSGGFVCMSRPLALIVGKDKAFGTFLDVAKARNTHGTRCHHPLECAAQPTDAHMWHHEDAGIGFNTFRAVVAANASAAVVPMPAHFNDPAVIERTPHALDRYWSSRAIFVHGVKDRRLYDVATARWSLAAPAEAEGVQCGLCRPEVSQGGYSWSWARLPCARPSWDQPQPGRWCTVEPDAHYTCCNWPWLPPRLRDAVLEALRDAPRHALQGGALKAEATRRLKASNLEPACVRPACEPLDSPPGGVGLHRMLIELARRGDVQYEADLDVPLQRRRVALAAARLVAALPPG